MKLSEVLGSIGKAVFSEVVPMGSTIIDLINHWLDDDKLDARSTGEQVEQAIARLTPAQRAEVLSKEVDFKIAEVQSWADIQAVLNNADGVGRSTRPLIAERMSTVVSFAIVALISCVCIALLTSDAILLEMISEIWPLILAVLAPPIALLRAYFGMRTREKQSRYAAAAGQPLPGLLGTIKQLFR